MAPDRPVDNAFVSYHITPGYRDIFLLDYTILKLQDQVVIGGHILGDDHHTRGVFVQSVHDTRTPDTADTFNLGAVMQQCVYDRTAPMTRCGVDRNSRGFIQNDAVGILIENGQREGLGADLGGARG